MTTKLFSPVNGSLVILSALLSASFITTLSAKTEQHEPVSNEGTPIHISEKTNRAKDNSLSLYRDGAIVFQRKSMPLSKGTTEHNLSPLADSIIPDSLSVILTSPIQEGQILESTLSQNADKAPYALSFQTNCKSELPQNAIELIYMLKNMSWSAHYTLQLQQGYKKLRLNSWVDITNHTAIAHNNTYIQFIDTKIPEHDKQISDKPTAKARAYTHLTPINLTANSTKRIQWASTNLINLKQDYRVFVGGDYLLNMENKTVNPVVQTWVTFQNSPIHGLGMDLPVGNVVMYYERSKNQLDFLGHTQLAHTNAGQEISVRIPSFKTKNTKEKDLKSIETELEQNQFRRNTDTGVTEAHYKLDLKNVSNEEITIKVMLDLPASAAGFEVIRATHTHATSNHEAIHWNVKVPAKSNVLLKYQIRYHSS